MRVFVFMASATSDNGTYHHGDLRNDVLRLVRGQLRKKALENISLREVARSLGVSHNAPYAHFPAKFDLIVALKNDGFEDLQKQFNRVIALQDLRPRERLKKLLATYVGFAAKEPQLFHLMFRVPIAEHPRKSIYVEAGKAIFQGITGCFSDLLREEKIPFRHVHNVNELALVAWSAAHGIISLWQEGPLGHVHKGDDIEELCRIALDCMISGATNGRLDPRLA